MIFPSVLISGIRAKISDNKLPSTLNAASESVTSIWKLKLKGPLGTVIVVSDLKRDFGPDVVQDALEKN